MKEHSHEVITKQAIELLTNYYQANNNNSGWDQVLNTSGSLIWKGSVNEDEKSVERASNWHFYNRDGLIENNEAVPGVPSSEILFHSRVMRFKKLALMGNLRDSDDTNEMFDVIGRILHHIQDMSTPSHVVPVYHGLFIKDYYEVFLEKCWSIIKPKISVTINSIPKLAKDNRLEPAGNSFYSLMAFYEQAADLTLEKLYGPNPYKIQLSPGVILTGETFWEKGEEFGDYTKACKSFKKFYKGDTTAQIKVNGQTYTLPCDLSAAYASEFISKSIIDTIVALDYIFKLVYQ